MTKEILSKAKELFNAKERLISLRKAVKDKHRDYKKAFNDYKKALYAYDVKDDEVLIWDEEKRNSTLKKRKLRRRNLGGKDGR